jgi:hypothetical protein
MPVVVNLAERTNDAHFVSVEQMLDMASKDYAAGELHGKKAVLLVLDKGPGNDCYDIGFRSANMQVSELVSLLTVKAAQFAKDLSGG